MRLTPMRFKDYTWPHNPESYTVEYRRQIAVHKIPFGRYVMQELGTTYRVLKGEGTFAGEHAYDQFQQLAAVFEQEGAGLLVHPVWQPARAYFTSLQLTERPLPDYVRYTFEFWEDFGAYSGGLTAVESSTNAQTEDSSAQAEEKTVYIVRKGDTLWGIAKQYNVELTMLIEANPQIKNPNLIYPGNRVNIP
jgi:spore coat assembly protein SafA